MHVRERVQIHASGPLIFQVPYIHHFEPSLDAFSLRSDVTSSTRILSTQSYADPPLAASSPHTDRPTPTGGTPGKI